MEVFSGLVAIDSDLKLVPDLAERWDISGGGTVYTFRLRAGARFHNGKEVTAQDFVWSINRAASPRTLSPVTDTYLGDIVGVKDVLAGNTKEVTGVKALDKSTLQITIDAPKAYFLAQLTYPTGYVLDRENVESLGRRWTEKPNGTGPFKLKEYRIGERIVLERNPNYYRGQARVEEVVLILSGGSAMAMYENGEIDITGVGLADLDRVKNPSDPLSKELKEVPTDFSISYIGFNTSVPPFDDIRVRQALNHAVNKKLIADQVFANLVVPANAILPPGFPGYNANVRALEFDTQRAKELLAQSKYAGKMPRITLTVPGTGGSIGLDLEVILEMWRQTLGVQVEIQQVEWATFLDELNSKKLQLYAGLGWSADYPDPYDFLDILFHSKSTQNNTAYASPELDALLEKARVEVQWEKRVELYNRAEEMILREAPWVPLWYSGDRFILVKPYVKGYKPTPLIVPKLKDVSIEK